MKDSGATVWSSWLPAKDRMRIGLISDTHIPEAAQEPPAQVAQAFEGVDLILHAGDIYVPSCLDWLERIAPVRAVEMGAATYFGRDPRVAYKQVMEVNGHSIGLVHDLMLPGTVGDVSPRVLAEAFPPGDSLPRALEGFFGTRVDTVVFGHTHEALVEVHQGVLLVNPGSPSSLASPTQRLGTVAILELTPEDRHARVIDLSELR